MPRGPVKSRVKQLTVQEACYLAGFLDGEGCWRQLTNQFGVKSYRISVSQKETEVLRWILKVVGVGDYKERGHTTIICRGKVHPRNDEWVLRRKLEVIDLTQQLFPYLIVKKHDAEHALAGKRPREEDPNCITCKGGILE